MLILQYPPTVNSHIAQDFFSQPKTLFISSSALKTSQFYKKFSKNKIIWLFLGEINIVGMNSEMDSSRYIVQITTVDAEVAEAPKERKKYI